jgi:predicted nucleic acid-binding protein
MRICIDSCVFIHGLQRSDPAAVRLLDLIGADLILLIPRLVTQEVVRNLHTPEQVRKFYRLFQGCEFAFIVDEPVPATLVDKYVRLGLPGKADAFIGAFAEWMQVRYLISDNRHFLRNLQTDAFDVVDATEFISRWEAGTL